MKRTGEPALGTRADDRSGYAPVAPTHPAPSPYTAEPESLLTGDTDATVLELLDRVLNTGVVLVGDLAISVADVELIYLRLQLMLTSAETARQAGWLATRPHFHATPTAACRE